MFFCFVFLLLLAARAHVIWISRRRMNIYCKSVSLEIDGNAFVADQKVMSAALKSIHQWQTRAHLLLRNFSFSLFTVSLVVSLIIVFDYCLKPTSSLSNYQTDVYKFFNYCNLLFRVRVLSCSCARTVIVLCVSVPVFVSICYGYIVGCFSIFLARTQIHF